ncbi:unnamed protein product [Rangifer tarandus platyrhynchus]|uniref:Uncharacterized protein n=2 Tax=Rangifer tarandus platyrhynchus TaxID=3082113 RepID=A0ACB0EDI3_RANTA|nr:unnamed protein product [Rangifer tarandus platyrhynchus]CAI9698680.1 unnamed protein product [Rangifer tarandus platyrhynchus]
MDGRGAGGLSGLIDEVRADSRRVTRGGGRRARGGRRAQTLRRSGSAPGRPPPPRGAPRIGSAEGAAGAEALPQPGARRAAQLPPGCGPASRPRSPAPLPPDRRRSLLGGGPAPGPRLLPAAAVRARARARSPPSPAAYRGRGALFPAEGPRSIPCYTAQDGNRQFLVHHSLPRERSKIRTPAHIPFEFIEFLHDRNQDR